MFAKICVQSDPNQSCFILIRSGYDVMQERIFINTTTENIQQHCWQDCQQYCWIRIINYNVASNIAGTISGYIADQQYFHNGVDFSTIFLAILLVLLLISNTAGNLVNNIADQSATLQDPSPSTHPNSEAANKHQWF